MLDGDDRATEVGQQKLERTNAKLNEIVNKRTTDILLHSKDSLNYLIHDHINTAGLT